MIFQDEEDKKENRENNILNIDYHKKVIKELTTDNTLIIDDGIEANTTKESVIVENNVNLNVSDISSTDTLNSTTESTDNESITSTQCKDTVERVIDQSTPKRLSPQPKKEMGPIPTFRTLSSKTISPNKGRPKGTPMKLTDRFKLKTPNQKRFVIFF